MSFEYKEFEDGLVICGDCMDPEVKEFVLSYLKDEKIAMFHWDIPYGNVVSETWDQTKLNQQEFADLMKKWIFQWYDTLYDNGSIYLYGGTGSKGFRPFYVFTTQIEQNKEMDLVISDVITWKKKRGFGSKTRLIYAREEILWMTKGKKHNPRVFNIPLTNVLRGYEGYNAKYKAKSPYKRYTNVWEITEMLRGKLHPTEKCQPLICVSINASTNPNEYVFDAFAGSFSTAIAARSCGRKFICIEKDPTYYAIGVQRLRE